MNVDVEDLVDDVANDDSDPINAMLRAMGDAPSLGSLTPQLTRSSSLSPETPGVDLVLFDNLFRNDGGMVRGNVTHVCIFVFIEEGGGDDDDDDDDHPHSS